MLGTLPLTLTSRSRVILDTRSDRMRIGELARRSGVSTRALRYYEERNLLVPTRSDSAQRHYSEEAVEHVRLIQRMYAAGLNSRAVEEMMPCVHSGDASADMLETLRAVQGRLGLQIDELTAARARLAEIIEMTEGNLRDPGSATPEGASPS
jgi:DNA-binding transcriptional MerR regulator